ncbi:MAG: Bug family tripartite tricarboxylate transporter substrate binding protein [Suipraeoptans sp.]
MKRRVAILLAGVMTLASLTACGSSGSSSDEYAPNSTMDWTVTSSPGGGSDIYTRMIADIMTTEDMIGETTVVVTNKTDGSGEVGRNEVANLKGEKADNTLLTFNSGDLMPMVQNTKNRAENFRIIAIMAVDKQLLFKGEKTEYDDFAEAIEAAQNGTEVIIGGSKGDDIATYEAMIAEIGVGSDKMKYITYDSTGDAITAALGGHVEFVISKPAAATEYVEAGSLIPVLALANERYTGNLADAPTLSEIGDYENVEVPVWRGVAASANMSDEAVAYWTEKLREVSETDAWKTDYLEKNKLIANYMSADDATAYVEQYEKEFMEAEGIE